MFSDKNLLFVSVWPTVLCALSVVLVIIEYKVKAKSQIFTAVSSLFLLGASAVLLMLECSLCDLLVLICVTLAVRLFFEIRRKERGK